MPEMGITQEMLLSGERSALIPVEATMLFPDDDRMRQKAIDTGLAAAGRGEACVHHPRADEKAVRIRFCQGLVAANYLLNALNCIKNNWKITYLPEEIAKGPLKNIEKALISPTVSRYQIAKYWSTFKDVSHLWLVYCSLANESEGQYPFPCDHREMPFFLALSEELRATAEGALPKGRGVPLLSPATTWKVPKGLLLPELGGYSYLKYMNNLLEK